ncbi:hypothetical protein ON003_07810 [Janibacter hoylei]|uniref:hypothetical protein n=1 Tax=Janibacter hoylei TaxID=364298 RepID=UPI00223745DD|nr:hypothetical protein [Janibacter hoylei]MCW4601501.1 hypothetical protein [Janibacter hoylei]
MAAAPLTEAEISALVARRYPDDARLRDLASKAAGVVRGDGPATDSFESIAQRYATALEALENARAELTGAIIAASGTEVSIAERAGVSRLTVRKARGK